MFQFRKRHEERMVIWSNTCVIEALAQAFGLTAREAKVPYWVVQGKINRDIAEIVGASLATVKKHL